MAPRVRAQHPAHMMYDKDDADLDGTGATGAIVLHALPPGVKFTITSTMIQLLNLKGMFRGAAGDDANQHLMNFVAICKSQEIPGVNQTIMRLRLFPLPLTGEATNWLNEMPDDSIRIWNELKEAFLERFFPESKELQMKDEISTHKQLPGEAMHDTWWRFSQKLKKCPNHDLTDRHLKQAFYRSLNYVTKPVVDAVCGGSFMRKPFAESIQLLDEVSKKNRAWYTRDAEVGELGYTFDLSSEQRKREEERDQDMADMRTQIDLLTKQIFAKSEKGYNSGNAGRSYARDGQYERQANRDQGNWQNREGYRTDRSGVYVPPGNRHRGSGNSTGSKLEDMMAKVLQKVESTDAEVKEMRGTNYEQVLEQASREKDENIQVDDLREAQKSQSKAQPSRGKEKEVQEKLPLQQIPRPPPHFPQRLKKKDEDGKFTRFITMLKQLSVNIPLVEALEQMPGYAKFMKDLVTKKRVVSHDFSNDVHHCSVIATRSLVQKKEDPGTFTISCTIGSIKFAKALCDL
ncbi:uncharacterized protein LOC125813838 [Solanum verrucosum]|uniref:uncharacterized protein LOC125813838 n=1 Tax=Solanum verrucosum TaxID=315347 RepID=UPI0020D06AAE|nr:uncharacterized protein LOC125813838 [Solanum verrucosum]